LIVGRVDRQRRVSTGSTLSDAAVRTSAATFATENGRSSPVYGVEGADSLFEKRARTGHAPGYTQELAPGIRLQVAAGLEVGFVNVGTDAAPVWVVSPGRRVGVLQETVETGGVVHDYSGFLPLLLAAARPAAWAVRQYLKNGPADEDPDEDGVDGLAASARCLDAGASGMRFDASGALLTDTDGKKALV
jgi:hypothetical protein